MYDLWSTFLITEVPVQPPTLTGTRPRYRLRDTLRANCTAAPSKPAVNLTWGLNGENVSTPYLLVIPNRERFILTGFHSPVAFLDCWNQGKVVASLEASLSQCWSYRNAYRNKFPWIIRDDFFSHAIPSLFLDPVWGVKYFFSVRSLKK